MSPDSANRSFLALVAIALGLGALMLWGALGVVLAPLLAGSLLAPPRASSLAALPFAALLALGLGRGGRSLAAQAIASRRLERRLLSLGLATPTKLGGAAIEAGLRGRVCLVEDGASFSFVHGALAPRVVVSRGLLQAASPRELQAVLEHERYHVCNLDPLKLALARALSEALFLLPSLGSLLARYEERRELAADRWALSRCGVAPLAGALLKVARGPRWNELDVAASIGGEGPLSIRVLQLESGVEPRHAGRRHARRRAAQALRSLSGTALLLAAFLASVWGLGGEEALRSAISAPLVSRALLGGLWCAAPFAFVCVLSWSLAAMRARRPLRPVRE